MPNWKKVIVSGSDAALNSLYAPSITGSLLGTASYAIYAETSSVSTRTTETDLLALNQNGFTIPKGTVVRITGSNNASDIPRIVTASYENDGNSANTLGITTAAISNGATGYVITEGVLTGIDTSNFTSGTLLYLGATGSIIGTVPSAPLHAVRLGQVIREQSNNGSIHVRIDNGYEIGELHDVFDTTTSTSYGDLLIKSASVWTNSKQLSGSYSITGSLVATSFTGSLFGTSSWASNAISASFASTASSVNTLNQNVLITGSLTVGATSIGASENTLTLGPRDNGSEGGQIMLQAPGGTYTSASMWDNYTNLTRLLRGTNAGSDAVVAQFNMHSKQISFPQYNSPTAFTGTTLVGLLGFDSSGNLLTTTTSSGGGSGVTITNNVDNYVITATGTANTLNGESNMQFNGSSLSITGEITSSGAIRSNANNSMYFRGGDDAEFWDINVANTVGIYGQQDATVASVKLGSGGGTISGKSGNIGIGTINPTSASLTVNGNVWANSFTGSLQGTATTASYVLNAVSASYAPNTTFPYTGSAIISGSLIVTGSIAQNASTASFGGVVGIGTTTPAYTLDVNGTARVNNTTIPEGNSFLVLSSTSRTLSFNMSGVGGTYSSLSTGLNSGTGTGNFGVTLDGYGTAFIIGSSNNSTSNARFSVNLNSGNAAQTEVIIGTQTSFASSLLTLNSTVRGFLPPRTNLTSNISTPAQGLMTYITASATEGLYYYSSGSIKSWTRLLNDTGSQSIYGSLGINRTSTASLDVAGTTRISGSFNTATSGSILTVIGSGSAQPIFTVQGSQGELFSITDSLSGSLFSVNDISGLPILEVFSDNTTLIGNYQDPMLITTAKVVQTNSGSFTVYSLPTASYDTAFFEYSIKSGSNARAGTIMAIQSGTSVNFTETTTTDFGSTSAVSFTVIVTGSNIALTGSSTSGAWTIKTIVRGI